MDILVNSNELAIISVHTLYNNKAFHKDLFKTMAD
jgi:hypothetical protein